MALLQHTSPGLGVDVVAALHAADPADPSTSRALGTGALVSWGPGRFVNRAIGVSLDPLGDAELDELEAFFSSAGVPPSIEVCSWAAPDLVARLVARRFVPIRFVDLLVAESETSIAADPAVTVRTVDDSTRDAWIAAYVEGFATTPDEERLNRELAGVLPHVPAAVHVLAEIDGDVAGCGSLYPHGSVGWVAGGSTRPRYRRRGVQTALLADRLVHARRAGCDVAAATANAGSTSSRNMQRHGFTLAATIVVMTRER